TGCWAAKMTAPAAREMVFNKNTHAEDCQSPHGLMERFYQHSKCWPSLYRHPGPGPSNEKALGWWDGEVPRLDLNNNPINPAATTTLPQDWPVVVASPSKSSP